MGIEWDILEYYHLLLCFNIRLLVCFNSKLYVWYRICTPQRNEYLGELLGNVMGCNAME